MAQTTIHVPADQPTIQAGIDAAANGDTVLVSPGTYTENIDFKGKAITVTSGAKQFSDAATTIITPAANGFIVTFRTNEPPTAVLNGFTIQNSLVGPSLEQYTGGISVSGASPTLSNNIVRNNAGCGVLIANGSNVLFQGNDVVGNYGALTNNFNTQKYSECTIPYYDGVGMILQNAGNIQLINNTIEGNFIAPGVFDNDATLGGDGILLLNDSGNTITMDNNTIRNNLGGYGLEGEIDGGRLTLIQNLFYGNSSTGTRTSFNQINISGSNFFTSSPTRSILTEINNTVYGGGEFTVGFGPSEIANSIFYNDSNASGLEAGPLPGLSCDTSVGYVVSNVNHNDIYNSGAQVPSGCNPGAGSLFVDPQFLDPGTFNFHTQPTSPVVAAGDINAPLIPPTDLDGKARTVCGTIDMGVYEVRPRPATVVTSSLNPSAGGTPVTFSAFVPGNCNVPTGDLPPEISTTVNWSSLVL